MGNSPLPPLSGLPRVYGSPACRGDIRCTVDDFRVAENLGFEPDGEGEHALLLLEKRNLTTEQLISRLVEFAGVAQVAVGYCGLKDRNAVTSQWFSVHLPGRACPDWNELNDETIRVLRQHRHRKKLRIGTHLANRFVLTIRHLLGPVHTLEERLQKIHAGGFANYFGSQRFGQNGGNLDTARRFFGGQKSIRSKYLKGLLYSAARAEIFNQVLARRVSSGDWNQCLPGDLMMLDGTNSIFRVDEPDEDLRDRTAAFDLHPTGPLFGANGMSPTGAPGELENLVLAEQQELAQGLLKAGLKMQRRALRSVARHLTWQFPDGQTLVLGFDLSAGSYATVVLDELLQFREGNQHLGA